MFDFFFNNAAFQKLLRWSALTIAPFTQSCRIIAAAVVCQFSAVGRSHRAKHLRLNDKLLCNTRKPALQLLKRRDSIRHDDDVCVFSRCLLSVSKIFLPVIVVFFGQKCDEELVGQAGGQTGVRTLLHIQLRYFFPHISCQRQLQLLHYFVWSCNSALWDISLCLVD